ncbi:hypothetical protein HPB50_027060 [Hyalomma asiaticum]|uniref:Uncharacterized protein n=1 Tax=Hyalomma asiaticum TaxID=266040 RepID=A0ACB7RT13_HYAAI|nr:hypothetical protein HPB50_027060 [Hyalomma asiaticum]
MFDRNTRVFGTKRDEQPGHVFLAAAAASGPWHGGGKIYAHIWASLLLVTRWPPRLRGGGTLVERRGAIARYAGTDSRITVQASLRTCKSLRWLLFVSAKSRVSLAALFSLPSLVVRFVCLRTTSEKFEPIKCFPPRQRDLADPELRFCACHPGASRVLFDGIASYRLSIVYSPCGCANAALFCDTKKSDQFHHQKRRSGDVVAPSGRVTRTNEPRKKLQHVQAARPSSSARYLTLSSPLLAGHLARALEPGCTASPFPSAALSTGCRLLSLWRAGSVCFLSAARARPASSLLPLIASSPRGSLLHSAVQRHRSRRPPRRRHEQKMSHCRVSVAVNCTPEPSRTSRVPAACPFESPRFPEPPDEGGGLGDSAADDDDDPLASSDCGDDVGPGCFPRPPEFGVPPPPLPPGLCSSVASGRRAGASAADELQFCEVRPVGAELTTPSAFPSLPVIAVCSSVVLVAVLVASFLLWK